MGPLLFFSIHWQLYHAHYSLVSSCSLANSIPTTSESLVENKILPVLNTSRILWPSSGILYSTHVCTCNICYGQLVTCIMFQKAVWLWPVRTQLVMHFSIALHQVFSIYVLHLLVQISLSERHAISILHKPQHTICSLKFVYYLLLILSESSIDNYLSLWCSAIFPHCYQSPNLLL